MYHDFVACNSLFLFAVNKISFVLISKKIDCLWKFVYFKGRNHNFRQFSPTFLFLFAKV